MMLILRLRRFLTLQILFSEDSKKHLLRKLTFLYFRRSPRDEEAAVPKIFTYNRLLRLFLRYRVKVLFQSRCDVVPLQNSSCHHCDMQTDQGRSLLIILMIPPHW